MSVLEVTNVNKSFGGLHALANVNLKVEEGTVHAIIGPNGAGKSTFLNCIIGRLAPDTGTVMFNGTSLIGMKPHKINQMGVVRVFQTPEIFGDLTLIDNVMIPAFAKADGSFALNAWRRVSSRTDIRDEAEHILEEVGLIEQKDILSSSLSRGDKRRWNSPCASSSIPSCCCLMSQPLACRGLIPTARLIFSSRLADAASPRSLSSMTCMWFFRWPPKFQFWPKAHLSPRDHQMKSRAIRSCKKPILEAKPYE